MKMEPLAGTHCHHCSSQPVYLISYLSPVDYRGLTLDVTKVFRECKMCGARWENTKDPDWREEAKRLYLETMERA
jgi:hypothetical protein